MIIKKGLKLLLIGALLLLTTATHAQVKVGAARTSEYLPLLEGQRVALVANQTSRIGDTHLLDTLLAMGVDVRKVFAPEHGFRGNYSAGAHVASDTDLKTGVPLVSLYGSNKKPSREVLQDVDVLVFDIQDVGVRFYTYISTLHYIMEACAAQEKQLILLDRPNPNGHYVDGPVLESEHKSFVGMHPVPIVHGMTVGEYAQMINGEGWLPGSAKCDVTVVPVENWTHQTPYAPPVAPSPNLPTIESIYLYPSLALFEGTDVSIGRGTDKPFEVVGKPGFPEGAYTFTPRPIPGVADHPKHEGQKCSGFDLTGFCRDFLSTSGRLYLYWLQGFYQQSENKEEFFNSFFEKLAGTSELREQIKAGKTIAEIRKSWQPELGAYKQMRKKYLLYPDINQ